MDYLYINSRKKFVFQYSSHEYKKIDSVVVNTTCENEMKPTPPTPLLVLELSANTYHILPLLGFGDGTWRCGSSSTLSTSSH